jgi:hypothetical protein
MAQTRQPYHGRVLAGFNLLWLALNFTVAPFRKYERPIRFAVDSVGLPTRLFLQPKGEMSCDFQWRLSLLWPRSPLPAVSRGRPDRPDRPEPRAILVSPDLRARLVLLAPRVIQGLLDR